MHKAAKHYFDVDLDKVSRSQALFLAERVALPNRWRSGRLHNILKRRIVRELVGADLIAVPDTYGGVFGKFAKLEIQRMMSELGYDRYRG